MNSIRWMIFLPAALVTSFVAGVVAAMVADFIGMPPYMEWTSSGVISGFILICVGFMVAPKKSKGVLISLLASLCIVVIIYVVDIFLAGDQNIKYLYCVGIAIGGWLMGQQVKDEISKNT